MQTLEDGSQHARVQRHLLSKAHVSSSTLRSRGTWLGWPLLGSTAPSSSRFGPHPTVFAQIPQYLRWEEWLVWIVYKEETCCKPHSYETEKENRGIYCYWTSPDLFKGSVKINHYLKALDCFALNYRKNTFPPFSFLNCSRLAPVKKQTLSRSPLIDEELPWSDVYLSTAPSWARRQLAWSPSRPLRMPAGVSAHSRASPSCVTADTTGTFSAQDWVMFS